MSTISTLGYALLSLLARGELSGYDIARQMKAPIGYFWHASHSQIYPELARLERDGYVGHQVVEQHDRPDKKVYSLTDAGREALRTWVTSPLDVPSVRDELVLRAFSLWLGDRREAAALFREHERRHEAQLEEYQAIEAHIKGQSARLPSIDSPEFAAYATLQRGMGYERECAAWCRWVAEQLEGGPV